MWWRVSSFQLETTTTFRPWIALWLNVAADHLDRHPNIEAYADAKARIFANQTPADWAVVNADDRGGDGEGRADRARSVCCFRRAARSNRALSPKAAGS